RSLDADRKPGGREAARIPARAHGSRQRLRIDDSRVRAEITAERELVAGKRLEVDQDVVFRPVAGRLDRELRIAPGVQAPVVSDLLLESPLVRRGDVRGEIHGVEPRIAILEVQGFDKTVEAEPRNAILAREQRPESVENVGIEVQAILDDRMGVARLP